MRTAKWRRRLCPTSSLGLTKLTSDDSLANPCSSIIPRLSSQAFLIGTPRALSRYQPVELHEHQIPTGRHFFLHHIWSLSRPSSGSPPSSSLANQQLPHRITHLLSQASHRLFEHSLRRCRPTIWNAYRSPNHANYFSIRRRWKMSAHLSLCILSELVCQGSRDRSTPKSRRVRHGSAGLINIMEDTTETTSKTEPR